MARIAHVLAAAALACALAPAATALGAAHTVVPGETLSGIAAANGLPTGALAAANGLSPTAFVDRPARTLQIPAPGAGSATPVTAAPSAATTAGGGGHLVQPGETLSGIAAANGVSTAALAAANGLSPTSFVLGRHAPAHPGPARRPRRPGPAPPGAAPPPRPWAATRCGPATP